MGVYKGGRITRIKMQNFMTFDDTEMKPKSGLNLIVGYNGSGKSSIMCAICLGLGGKPEHTGRSGTYRSFIKKGREKATIEIELENTEAENTVIKRVIHPTASEWLINNKPAETKDVEKIVKNYNIDTSNLCQFLPQEKVSYFAKTDKRQRLVNMINSIGEPELRRQFEEMKALSVTLADAEKSLEEVRKTKESEEEKNRTLQGQVTKQEEREKLKVELEMLQMQRKGHAYNSLRSAYFNLKKEVKSLEETKNKMAADLNDIRERLDVRQSDWQLCVNKEHSLGNEISETSTALWKCLENLNRTEEQADLSVDNYKEQIDASEKLKIQLQTSQSTIEELQSQLQEGDESIDDIAEQILTKQVECAEVDRELTSLNAEITQTTQRIEALDCTKKIETEILEREGTVETVRLNNLKRICEDTYKAVKFAMTNPHLFCGVTLPPLLSLEIVEEDKRKFFENHVEIKDLLTFLCTNIDTYRNVRRIFWEKLDLRVSIGIFSQEDALKFPSPVESIEDRRSLGIECFLRDVVRAPEPVLQYLCAVCDLHRIPILSTTDSDVVRRISEYCNTIFTPADKITVKHSSEDSHCLSLSYEPVIEKNIFPDLKGLAQKLSSGRDKLQTVENELSQNKDSKRRSIQRKVALETKLQSLGAEKQRLSERAKFLDSVSNKMRAKAEFLRKRRGEVVDEREEKRKLNERMNEFNRDKLSVLPDMVQLLKKHLASKALQLKYILTKKSLNPKMLDLTAELKEKGEEFKDFQEEVEEKKTKRDNHMTQAKQLYDSLKTLSSLDYVLTLVSGSTLEEVDNSIANIEARLELNNEDLTPVVSDYVHRKNRLSNLEKEIREREVQLKELQKQLRLKRKAWTAPLRSHIAAVNKKFSKYFKGMKCAGEISLDEGQNQDDLRLYGLRIQLKYRAESEFEELSPTHHSGGECSVAAILFILSLQELVPVPFRCIDEINQGLDSVNERKVFEFIADAARDKNCSQYFMLTPKLMLGLPYHREITVHVIINSNSLKTKVAVDEDLKRKRSNRS